MAEKGVSSPVQRAHELCRARIAVERIFFQAAAEDVQDLVREVGERSHGKGVIALHAEELVGGMADEGGAPGEGVVEGSTELVDVGALVGAAFELLRGGVGGGAGEEAGEREARGRLLAGDAEVGDLGAVLLVEEDVLGFDVAVDDAAGAGLFQGAPNLAGNAEGALWLHRALSHRVGERLALDKLHDEEVLAVLHPEVLQSDGVGRMEEGDDVRLAFKALEVARVAGGQLGAEELDSDAGVVAAVDAFHDDAHAAAAELAEQAVVTKRLREAGFGPWQPLPPGREYTQLYAPGPQPDAAASLTLGPARGSAGGWLLRPESVAGASPLL